MTSNAYARRYSQAIFRMAQESKDLNRWQSDLRKVASLTRDQALFSRIADLKVPGDERKTILTQRIGEVNPLAIKLALLLASKGRLALLDDIAEEYQSLLENY
ncbi:MAG: F0F1 ATP synthase subunit delta, partial [Dehalococcoidales bacterium]|nr:F0F1 ATP synthase subunit delta [Dehalococcoidales bacterium]